MARPERFELPTTKFVAWYSIQLSYGRALKTVPRRPELRSLPLRAVESSAKARDYSDPRALRQPFSLHMPEVSTRGAVTPVRTTLEACATAAGEASNPKPLTPLRSR